MTTLPPLAADLRRLSQLLVLPGEGAGLPPDPAAAAELAQLAVRQGVAPLLYRALDDGDALRALPAAPQRALANAYFQTMAYNHMLLEQARLWARRFAARDIEAIWFKGVPLSLTVYPDPALRPMGDIDVLVPRRQLPSALALVEEITGRRTAHVGLETSMHANVLLSVQPKLLMELHWHLLDVPASSLLPDVGWFLEQRSAFTSEGATLFTFRPEAHLLYLCAHAEIAHGEVQFRLLRYLDLHLLLAATPAFNWELLVEHAVRLRWSFAVERALGWAAALFATPLPPAVVEALQRRRAPDEDTGIVVRRMRGAGRWQATRARLATMSWRMRVRLLVALAFPSQAYMRWRYPIEKGWQLPLYYLYRWLFVLREIAASGVRRARRSR